MDIEFSLYNGTLYVLQARPVTHLLSIPNGWVEFSLWFLAINPLIHPYEMDWACFVNSRDLKIMKKLITPMGYSLYRHLFRVSERYLCYVNGVMFINLCGCFSTFFTRFVVSCPLIAQLWCVDAYKKGVDPEIAQIMKELYHDDYARFDHKTAKHANSILKNELIKPIIKEVLRGKCCRWGVEQLSRKLEPIHLEIQLAIFN